MQLVAHLCICSLSWLRSQSVILRASRLLLLLTLNFFVYLLACPAVHAQTFTVRYIGTTGATGTYSTGAGPPPTYTISGAGIGLAISSGSDAFAFANLSTSGNIELQGKITAIGSTSANSQGGLILRESYAATSGQVAIYLTAGNGVKFTSRIYGSPSVTVNGSAATAPVFLRLTKNGNTYAGYESADGVSWTLVGSLTQANLVPQLYFAGFLSSSTSAGTLNSVNISNFSYMTSVPQQETDLLAWYRSDAGVTQSAGAISSWADQSGNSNDATQSTAAQKPTLVSGAVHSSILPSVSFDGTNDNLSMPTDFSDLTAGASVFVVLKPTSTSGTRTPITVGNSANADALIVQTNNTDTTLVAYNNTTSSSVSTSNNPITVNSYQVLEHTFEPGGSNGTGTIFVNGVQKAQATNLVSTLRNVSRANNSIGMSIAAADFFEGEIAEILFYKTKVSESKRASIESYFLSKFGVGTQPTLDAPVMTPGSAVLAPFQTVTMSQNQGATIYYSVDGSTPNTGGSYPWYNGESLNLPATTTINAIAVAPYFNNSSASATYRVDPDTVGIPRNGLQMWLMANDGVTLSSGNVSVWADRSGNGNSASQTNPSNRPGFLSLGINNLPAVTFNGSSHYLALPSGFSSFASGASIFVVVRPIAVSAGARIIDLGNGATSNNVSIQEPTNTGASLYVYNGSTPSSVTSSSAITLGKFQLLEAIHDGSTTATILTNALQGAQSTSMNSITNVLRANNYLGQGSAGGNYFNGEIAEILAYNRAVTSLERSGIESALMNKYQALTAVSSPAPIISVATGTLSKPTQVAISAQAGATTYFTTDGTTPTTGSPVYTGPLNIYYTQTVKAMSVLKGVQSSISSATYTLSSTEWPAPDAGDPTQLDIQLKLPSTAIP